MYKIYKRANPNIFFNIDLITTLMSTPYSISYYLAIKTFCITHLQFIKNLCIIFTLLVALAKYII